MQNMLDLYFNGATNLDNSTWQLMHLTRSEPVFMHLHNDEIGSDVIAVRGTKSTTDALQDFSLYFSVAMLQTISLVIPITSLAPTSFVINMVHIMGWFEEIVNDQVRSGYDTPVFEYAYKVLRDSDDDDLHSLYIVGHSLGGGISQAVAAQLYYLNEQIAEGALKRNVDIKSLALAAPGMVYGSKKFDFDLESLYMTSIVVRPEHDVVSTVDEHGGLQQKIQCSGSSFAECHLMGGILCELREHCPKDSAKSPELYSAFCEDTGVPWAQLVQDDDRYSA